MVYLSGPMTGLPDLNFPAFNAEAQRLRRLGHKVINPAELNKPGKPYEECMRHDIRALTLCSAVQLLPGWCGSRGVSVELAVAKALGMRVFDPHSPIMEVCRV